MKATEQYFDVVLVLTFMFVDHGNRIEGGKGGGGGVPITHHVEFLN